MAEESITEVKEIENCFVTNPPAKSEDGSMETLHENVISVLSKDQEECTSVPKPQAVALRRYSTGTVGARASNKLQVQSRYRGDHHVASIHDLCKHGKKCDHDDAVKPWKMIGRRKSVEGGSVTVKVESSSLKTKSLGSVSKQIQAGTKPESSVAAKRDVLTVKRKPSAFVNSETSSKDGSSVKSNDKARKNQESESGSSVVKKVPGLRNDKSNTHKEKVSRISGIGSSKVYAPKSMEKAKTQTISSEDVKERTVCVVESSVKGVQKEKQPPSSEKKESGSLDVEANPKIKKKIRPKRTEVKVNLTKQLSFKRGKVLDPKPEDSSPKWIKFRKRVVQELKTQTEGKKKNLKGKRFDVAEMKRDSCESSKREKVVLKHRQVEGKKKMMTLFNNVIEETVNKLTKVRKNKVKALIGAFETVISLQDTKTPHRVQSKATTTSASKVSPLASEQ